MANKTPVETGHALSPGSAGETPSNITFPQLWDKLCDIRSHITGGTLRAHRDFDAATGREVIQTYNEETQTGLIIITVPHLDAYIAMLDAVDIITGKEAPHAP